MAGPTDLLVEELQAPTQVAALRQRLVCRLLRLLLGGVSFALVLVLRYPDWFWAARTGRRARADRLVPPGRPSVHARRYALALLSLMLRRQKAIGFTALAITHRRGAARRRERRPRETSTIGASSSGSISSS